MFHFISLMLFSCTFVAQGRQEVCEKETVKFGFHVFPFFRVEVDPLQVMVLFAPDKEIAPCHTGDTHLSHHLVVVLMDCLQSIGSIGLAIQVCTLFKTLLVWTLDLQKSVGWCCTKVTHLPIR